MKREYEYIEGPKARKNFGKTTTALLPRRLGNRRRGHSRGDAIPSSARKPSAARRLESSRFGGSNKGVDSLRRYLQPFF